jgi:hypothetical protein
MALIYGVLTFALLILICIGCRTQYGENWQKVSLTNSSIMMPGKAERTQEGTITRYMLNYNSELYMASSAIMVTPPREQIDQALDSVRNGTVTGNGGTLLSERSISLGGFPGRELTYEEPKYGKTTKERMYLAKSILYQISVSWNTSKSITGDGEKFLDSFEIQSR